ncbi:MAG: SDR family NAD(P)-dependent oxidoreductase [Chloroflexaceae bacterium]
MKHTTEAHKNGNWWSKLGLLAGLLGGLFAWRRLRAPANDGGLTNGRPRTALITGASSGIGATFARHLAALGYDLLLVARREDRLRSLADELKTVHAVNVEVLVADLANPADVEQLEKQIARLDTLELLINNAGFGTTGLFAEVDVARHSAMIQVHVTTSMRLCRAALPRMLARRRGGIINVSSVTAFLRLPNRVNYCATKAYLTSFTEALATELTGTGVRVQALCPNFTYTEFHDTPEYASFERTSIPRIFWSSTDEVVRASLAALRRNRVVCIPGWQNRLLVAVLRFRGLTAPLVRARMAHKTRTPGVTDTAS